MFRFGTVLLSCNALSFSGGHFITAPVARLCYLLGLSGFAFYFVLELVADQYARWQQQSRQQSDETRLARRITIERPLAVPPNLHAESDSGCCIESAMDSHADLAVFVGPTGSPILSA
jgi:hypothetical protein